MLGLILRRFERGTGGRGIHPPLDKFVEIETQQAEARGEGDEFLLHAVVEVALDAAALGLKRFDERQP